MIELGFHDLPIILSPYHRRNVKHMTLTKDKIIEAVHENLKISKTRAKGMVEYLFETLKNTLANGEDVLISGFGKFSVKKKKERRGRNPATGEDLTLDARKIVTFSTSPVVKKRINR